MKIQHSKQLEELFGKPLNEDLFQEILERIVQAKQETQIHLQPLVVV